MRRIASAALFGGIGFVVGALTYGWFAAHTLDTRNQMLQTQFATEQHFRATRAERQTDFLAALHHQWNSVEAQSPDWLHEFTNWEAPRPWFAFELAILGKIMTAADPEHKGAQIGQGIARGHLARLLEANGYKAKGAEQWELATKLVRLKHPEKIREFIGRLRAQQDLEIHQRAEQAVLGP